MFSEVAEIALVAARLGQFQQLPKTRVILILNFTRPHAITYTKRRELYYSGKPKVAHSRGFVLNEDMREAHKTWFKAADSKSILEILILKVETLICFLVYFV